MRAMNELNKRMRDEMRVSLNDFYDEIGLSEAEVESTSDGTSTTERDT